MPGTGVSSDSERALDGSDVTVSKGPEFLRLEDISSKVFSIISNGFLQTIRETQIFIFIGILGLLDNRIGSDNMIHQKIHDYRL